MPEQAIGLPFNAGGSSRVYGEPIEIDNKTAY